MKKRAVISNYKLDYQSFIDLMQRAWLLVFSIGFLLPMRWLPELLPQPKTVILPATFALIACGELVLGNPTLSPAGPYCKGDVVQISFTGTNLPDGDSIQVYIDDISTYNPFSGGGTKIGAIPIDYSCSTCPTLLGLMSDPCAVEDDNEFLAISSGCGFSVANLNVNYDANNNVGGIQNADVCSSCNCLFVAPPAALIAQLQASSNCPNLINSANATSIIPAGAVVIVFTDVGTPSVPYNFGDLCLKGEEIYILQSSCERTIGAFTNNPATPRTYAISVGSCTDQIVLLNDPSYPVISGTTQSIFSLETGAWVFINNCTNPPWNSVDLPNIPNTLASLSYTIPEDICGSATLSTTLYISGIVDLLVPCLDVLLTPPSALSIAVACAPVITPAGPFCVGAPSVTLSASPAGGTWSGSPAVNPVTGVFNPATAGIGPETIIYTTSGCMEADTITITVTNGPIISQAPGILVSVSVSCQGESNGEISFDPSGISGGTSPYSLDWDFIGTPANDVYPNDGTAFNIFLNGIPAGFYRIIVTDATGCMTADTVEVENAIPFNISTDVVNNNCSGQSIGSISITIPNEGDPYGPTGFWVYNWDFAGTAGDQDYGAGAMNWGLPPATDDQQDISGLAAGTYYLTISVSDDPSSPGYTCVYLDTFIITSPPTLTVTAPNVTLSCFGQTSGSVTASPSGGTPGYTYNWSHIPGVNNPQTVTGLTFGSPGPSYIVTVTDANLCTASTTVTVSQPSSALMATAIGEAINCNDNTGDINMTPSGGTMPYTYVWNTGPTTQDLSGLNAGTYTVTVTDANGCTTTTSAVITLNPPTFTLPPNGGSSVPCIINAQVVPTPPAVNNSCGAPLTISSPVVSADPVCSGTKTYTFTYTDPATGITGTWVYTYTITPPTFTLPPNGTSTVACIVNAQTVPVPPPTNNSCGTPLSISGPVVGADPVCSGTKTYTWTYTDCTGSTAQWVHTYTVSPPTFTLPGPGSSTVACISNAQVVPTPPATNNSCGTPLVVTGPVVGPDPVCSGTKNYTWTYTDCTGSSATWVYTYTVSPPTFTLPSGGSSTVACISNAQVVPTPPPTNNSCGTALAITGPVVGPDPVCSGTKTYTWTYTDCTGSSAQWVYTYTVSPPTFTLPATGSSTVACIIDAQVVPSPPTVTNSCGATITPTGPVVGPDPVCSGTKTYTWTYTDCTGSSAQWVYTYTVSPPTFAIPAAGGSTVPCISNAQVVPTPPPANNSCGAPLTISGPVVGPDPVCSGTKTYTWTYTNCTGSSLPWVYTYTISAPTFTLPAPGGSTVACISNAQVVPTPPVVNNSCGTPISPTGPTVGPDPVCSGTKTYTWTYTDCTGSSAQWVYTYTISAPTFSLPAAGGSTVPCIVNAQTTPTPPVVNNSCGTPLAISGPVVGADPVCSGTKTYTWTYTDCTGTSGQWVYTYMITPPTISAPAAGSSTVACVSNAQVVPTPPVVNNSCGTASSISGPVVGPDPVCSGTKTYTWTYTDCTGSTVQYVYTYTVTPPTATMPPAGGSTVPCIVNAQTTPTPPVVNNSCGIPLTITGPVVGPDPVCSGTKTYTWTYTDCTGSSAQWVYTYTILPATFTLPANGSSTVPCISNALVVPTPPTVTNSCGTNVAPTGPIVGASPACSGTKTYTWTYTECSGSSAVWTYTYTILPPTFTLPANGSSTVPCLSDAQVTPTPPTVTNSCGTAITPTGPVVGANPVCSGPKTYTWTYTDCTGSSAQWVYTFNVLAPTFTLPAPGSSTVACISNAQVVPTPPAVNNSCGVPMTPTGPVAGPDPICSGTKTYTWTYADCTGTSNQWVYTYTVAAPTFNMPSAGSSTVACVGDAQVTPTPPVVNNSCGAPLTMTGPVVSADPVCSGTKTYTWTYTDCTGTTGQWVYTYTVTPPTATSPPAAGSTVSCVSDAQVVPTPPAVNNSCGDPLSITGPVVGADPVCSGTKTYTWTYTNCTGSTAQWVYTYTVMPPTATLPPAGSSTVSCISNAQVVPTPPVVNNSCGDALTISGPVVGADPVCSGTKTYTWTYTDCTGSSIQWVYTYTVSPPTFTIPANGSSTVACISDAQVVPTPPSVNNSCGVLIVPTGPVVGADPVCSGTKTYTWTYTDCTGSSAQWIFTYTINAPTFTLPANGSSTVACVSDAQVIPTAPTMNNSCGTPIVPTGPVVSPDPVCSGTKTYTWTYTDCSGSAATWVYTYTVTPPTSTVPPASGSTVACISDAQVVPTPPVVNNSCGDPLNITGPVVGADPVCSGTKTYTWTYTDCTGSSGQYIYTYTISAPTFAMPAGGGSTVACVSDAQVIPAPPAVNNSCGVALTLSGPVVSADPVCSGTKTYTWTYTDCTGSSAQWVYTYTITPPTATSPSSAGSTVSCVSGAQVVPTPPVVNNSCGDPLSISGPVVGPDPVCSGTKTYTWTYTNCTGSSSTWVYTYTVMPPTAVLPPAGASTVACISDAQVIPTPPAVMNSCGDPLVITGPVVGADPVCSGTKTYTFTYTDCTGSAIQWIYTYTVSPPTFTLPVNGSSTVACISNAQVVPTPPTVTNSCGDPVPPGAPSLSADPVCSGTKTYTWTYADCSGGSVQWVYTYTITPPTFTLPAAGGSTVACIANAQTIPSPPVVNNSCGTALTISGPVVGADPVCSGTKTFTYTYTDCTGSSSNWVYTYTITPPTYTMPANGSSTVACVSNAQIIPTPPVVNNSCGTALTITGPVVGADPVCSGTKTYTWTYTDCTGSSGEWVYTYTVTPPTATLPPGGSSTVACVSNAQVVPTPPVVNNSCGDPLTISGPVVGADPVCSGTKTYTWTYTDCTGATTQWVYTYTITPPTATLPSGGSSTVACISDAQVIPTPPAVNNSCGDPLTISGPVVGADPVCSGTKTYTWTYTDCTGSTAQWVYTYTITPPTFTLPSNGSSTVACISDAQVIPTPPTVTNSCGDLVTPSGPVVGADPVCSGTKTYTWTYTDCTGSSAPWIYTYTIAPPTFTLPAPSGSTVACINNSQVTPTSPTVNNSCGDPVIPTGPVVGADPVCSGTKTYTWTYADCSGGTVQWVYTYTITPPTFTLPAAGGSTVACIANAQTIPTPPAVNNSCATPLTISGPVVGADPICSGTKTYTWTYTDCTGSSGTWVYTYTIPPPTFTLPASGVTTVACVSDAQIIPTPPTVNNSCGAPLTISGPVVSADPVCSGTKTYTWTYTDCTGSSAQWVYTYTISPPTATLPANGNSTVACISDAQVIPTPPAVNNSCGDPLSVTGPVIGADPVCSGTKTYTWTYTDCTGATSQWVYTYTITPPTFTLPPAAGSTVACVSDAQIVPTPPAVNNSCGAPLSLSGPVVSADPICSGTKTYTWTYTDCTGSSSPWVYTYTINPPTFTLPVNGGSTVACISDAQVVPSPPAVNNSCGDPVSPSGPVVGADPVCSGTKTYTYTYTDCTGSTAQWTYTYTITSPTFTSPPNNGSTVACVIDAQVIPTAPAADNSCGDPLTISGPVVSADPVCSGTKTYTWTYTDCTGNSAPWVYTYTITPPSFTLPANDESIVSCVVDAQVIPTPPAANNSCGNPLTILGPVVSADPVCSGTKTYTWTYTDCTGTTDTWVYTYTITPPTAVLPPDGGSTVACVSDAQVVPTPPVVNNSCGDPLTISGPVVGPDPVCSGTKTYTWTYTDCTGSSTQWIYTYIITPPTATLPPDEGSTVACLSEAQVIPIPPTVTNSCGDPLTITGPVVGPDPVCAGTKTYTWTYTDCTGSSTLWVYTYTNTTPSFSLPVDGGSNVACVSDAQITPTPPAVNNSCGDPLTISGPVVGADPICSGTKTYTWTFTDCTGSTAQWTYTYTITPPTFTLPPNNGSTVACIIDAQVIPTPPAADNSCGDPLTISGPVVSADPVCSGTKTNTWTYTDCTGNSAPWVYTYTITPPTFTLPADDGSIVSCVIDAQVIPTPPAANNSCGDSLTITGPVVSADPACSGIKTYTWTYMDCTGNSAQWVYTYTITPPTGILPADDGSTVACIIDAQVVPTPPTVTNSCGDLLAISGPVVGADPVCSGTKTYTWTYTDCSGSTANWIYTYTISADVGPIFDPAPADISISCIGDVPPMVTLAYTDDCSPNGTVSGTDSPMVGSCPGVITRTWTFTDNCGNTGTATQLITVNDIEAPTASDPSPISLTGCNASIPAPDITVVSNAADNCGTPTVTFESDASSLAGCVETTIRTYRVTDGCNNSIVVSQTITRTFDIIPPVFSNVPVDVTLNCLTELTAIPDLSYTDNCSAGGTISGTETPPSGNPSTIIRTWTFTDDCGNATVESQTITILDNLIPLNVNESLCAGGSVVVFGVTYTMTGTFLDTVMSSTGGCDTAVTIMINVAPLINLPLSADLCPGETVIFYGITYSADGTYFDTIPSTTGGCDTAVAITINGIPYLTNALSANLCPEEIVTFYGVDYATAGTYLDTVPSVTGGCDTTVTITITTSPFVVDSVNVILCAGESTTFHGEVYNTAGTFRDTLTSLTGGCDTAATIVIAIIPYILNDIDASYCEGGSVVVYEVTYDMPGTYVDTIMSVTAGCDTAVTINISEIPATPANIGTVSPLCTTAGTVTLMGTPSGGVWSGSVNSDQFNPALLGAGIHQVIYTVNPGPCVSADTINITVYELMISCQALVEESAPGANDGEGEVTVSGGVPPYNISWSGPVSGSITLGSDGSIVITSLSAGIYTIEVEDDNGCTATCQFVIDGNIPCVVVINNIITQDATCPGVNNGIITVESSGGVPPHEYSKDGVLWQFSNVFTGLAPGTYSILVRDATGCAENQIVSVGVGPGPTLNIVEVINAECGVNNGSVEVIGTGGTISYTYSIDGISYGLSGLFGGLGAGDYMFFLIDGAGCTDTISQSVIASNAPIITDIDITDASCGQSDGSISIEASGGTGTLMYSINGTDFFPSPIFDDLPSGTYPVFVEDALGCPDNGTATIQDEGGPMIIDTNFVLASCGAADGSITIIATGNSTLSYSINCISYVPGNIFNNLPAGNYTICVRDQSLCVTSIPVVLNTLDGPQIDIVNVTNTSCEQENGTIEVIASGGVGDLEFFFNGVSNGDDNTLEDLPPGDYDIEVVDENGCPATDMVTINASVGPNFDDYVTPAHCGMANGAIELDWFGGIPPYMSSINGGPFTSIMVYTNLIADIYTMAVKDAQGCIYEEDVNVFEINGPAITNVIVTQPDCGQANGSILITASPLLGLTYSIGPAYPTQTTPLFSPVATGTYPITVTDAFGCTATAATVVISPKTAPIINANVTPSICGQSTGSITVLATLGVLPYTYSLDGAPFVPGNVFTGLASGSYEIIVQGANGCRDTMDVVIISIGQQTSAVSAAICDNDEYIIEGDTFTMPGNYVIVLPNGASNGCDSVIDLTLSGLPYIEQELQETICAGEIYIINGVDYSVTGEYLIDTIPAATGCDTIRTLNLSVNQLDTTYLDEMICTAGVFTINGIDYTVAGEYLIDTIPAVAGCDSVRILRLMVNDYNLDTLFEEICEGEIFTLNGIDYTIEGTYLIDTLAGPGGCDTIQWLNLSANPVPVANAGADQLLDCDALTVVLNGSAAGGTPFWTGPDINAGNQNQLTPTVSLPGAYTLTVTSTTGCVATDIVNVASDPGTVIANAGVDDSLSCDVVSITLQASPTGPDFMYQWTGPGINATNENVPNLVITVAGTYTLVVTNIITNCVSAPDAVTISDITANIIAIIQDPNSLTCFTTSVDLTTTGSSAGANIVYIWMDENGNFISDSPLIEVQTGGNYMFIVKDTLSGCFDDTVVTVEDLTIFPAIDAGPPQVLDCNNLIVILNEGATNVPGITYAWTGPGILPPSNMISVTVGTAGQYNLVGMDTATGCTNEDSVMVTDMSTLPIVDIGLLESFTCIDSTAMLDIGSSDTGPDILYAWNGPLTNGVNTLILEPTEAGIYYLTVINETTGCESVDSIQLLLPQVPDGIDADIDIPICEGDTSGSILVTNVSGGSPVYMYSLEGGAMTLDPLFEGLMAGNYTLQVVDENGCTYQETFTVPDGQLLTIDIGSDIDLDLGDSIILNANVSLPWSQIDSIVWSAGDHLSCTHCTNPTLYGLLDEVITATVYAGGCIDEDMLTLRVDVEADVYIPNIFSPNDDYINDYVTVYADPRVRRVVYLEIFDRWGNQVFVGEDFLPNVPESGWDGKFKNKPLNPAVFAYTAKVELINGAQISYNGDITLVR